MKANDVNYTIDGDRISAYNPHPTHMQTSTPGVVMNIDGDKFQLGEVGQPARKYEGRKNPEWDWL